MPVPSAMQGFFKLPWYADNNSAQVSQQQPMDERMEAPPAAHVFSSDNKRKRIASPEPLSPPRTLAKKPRAAGDRQYRLPLDVSQTPFGIDFDQSSASLAYATPGATPTTLTHRPDYMSSQLSALDKPATDESEVQGSGCFADATLGAQRCDSIAAACAERSDVPTVKDSDMKAMAEDGGAKAATSASTLSALQQAIENQINMQILMKHNELRLIEQETAKCQVALEQLRRCELRPFPGVQAPSHTVSSGTGPAIHPRLGFSRPSHAAPHGVVDGPYTRHYGKWLLADPQFDSEPTRAPYFAESAAYAANRSTRNSGTARKSVGKPIPAPAQADYPASIPNYPPPTPARKEKAGPLILRRSTDNKLVKLVCNNCGRGDMNSIQGFLNHCRIAHKIDYRSHDAAATDCGHAMDEDEIAKLPAETQSIPVSKPAPRATLGRASMSAAQHMTHHAVHPLNVSGAKIPQSARQNNHKKRKAMSTANVASAVAKSHAATPFKASPQAPRLSALFAKNNVGGDLEQAIANAKQRVDLSAEEDTSSPDVSSPASPATPFSGAARTLNAPGAGLAARPPSRKGHRQPTQQRPRPSPLAPTAQPALQNNHTEIPESPHGRTSLSPHTADSAPGLISDMEDDDHGSASEEETAIAPPSRGPLLPVNRTCADNMDLDITVDDEMDEHGVIIRRNSMLGSDDNRHLAATASSSSSRKLGGQSM